MKKFKLILLLISLVGLAIYTLPAFGSDTADVNVTATLAAGPPVVETVSITNITTTSFTANGNITSIGGSAVTRRGFCYITGSTSDPTTANSVVYEEGAFETGAYSINISGLAVSTNYRVRAYAINTEGTSYGTTLQVATKAPAGVVVIRASGTAVITGPSPFTDNITSIYISGNGTMNDINIEVDR